MSAPVGTWTSHYEPGGQYSAGTIWIVITANVVFATGLIFHAFLYNFYLEALGHPATVMGNAAAALTLGGLLSLLPAGALTDRVGIRAALVVGATLVTSGLAAGAFVEAPVAIYLAAAVGGAGGGAWRVASPPTLMRMAAPLLRSRVFAWNVGLLVTAGGVGHAVAGAIPGWVETSFGLSSLAAIRVALLVGAAGSALSIVVFAVLPGIPGRAGASGAARESRSSTIGPRSWAQRRRTILPIVILVGVWMVGPALAAPFLNIFFTRRFALTLAEVGAVFAATQLIWGAAVFASGALAGRLGLLRFLTITLAGFAPAMLGLSLASGMTVAAMLFFVQGLISPLTNPVIDQVLLVRAPAEKHGLVSSWRNAAADLSALAGASLGGYLLAETSFATLFAVAGVVGLAGAAGLVMVLAKAPPLSADARRTDLPAAGAGGAP